MTHDYQGKLLHKTTRRSFMKGAAALAGTAPALARAGQSKTSRPILAYVGTYSAQKGPEGSTGRGQGIYLFEMNPATGALTQREVFPNDRNPACVAFDPSRTHLYSANEVSGFEGTESGSINAYAIDRATGHLTFLNAVNAEGAGGPTHMSIHPAGKFAFAANYEGGTVAVFPIGASGELGPASDVIHNKGKLGPDQATNAPKGSFAISGHDHAHAHMIQTDPAGRYVFSPDLGLDEIFIWKFDAEAGKLIPNDPPSLVYPPGDGPRHFTFHPNGRWFYSIQEEASTLVTCDYDAKNGRLTPKQTISTLPKGFVGTNFTSALMISADGKVVYGANRLHDSIAWFTVNPTTGTLTFGGEEWTRGDYPRTFNIDPTGNFLYSCNQRADNITTYKVNRQTGALTFTGQYTPVGTAAMIIFLT